MNRIELEAKLGRDRAKLIELFEGLSEADLTRDATPSEHDSSTAWSANDHLAHLAGIEKSFNRMIRRHLDGDKEPLGPRTDAEGNPRSREQIMASVHESNEDWVSRHRGMSLSEIVAVGQQVRGETLALLAELSDEQLLEQLCPARPGPTAPSAACWPSTAITDACTGRGSAKDFAAKDFARRHRHSTASALPPRSQDVAIKDQAGPIVEPPCSPQYESSRASSGGCLKRACEPSGD